MLVWREEWNALADFKLWYSSCPTVYNPRSCPTVSNTTHPTYTSCDRYMLDEARLTDAVAYYRVRRDEGTVFLGDGSLAAAPTPKLNQRGIRPVIKVVDDRCL